MKQLEKERKEEARQKVDENAINTVNKDGKKFTQVTVFGGKSLNFPDFKYFLANNFGQLGFESEEMLKVPKTLSFNIFIRQVACGQDHTHLLSKDGHLYSMGSNSHG